MPETSVLARHDIPPGWTWLTCDCGVRLCPVAPDARLMFAGMRGQPYVAPPPGTYCQPKCRCERRWYVIAPRSVR